MLTQFCQTSMSHWTKCSGRMMTSGNQTRTALLHLCAGNPRVAGGFTAKPVKQNFSGVFVGILIKPLKKQFSYRGFLMLVWRQLLDKCEMIHLKLPWIHRVLAGVKKWEALSGIFYITKKRIHPEIGCYQHVSRYCDIAKKSSWLLTPTICHNTIISW